MNYGPSPEWYVHIEGQNPSGPMPTSQVRQGIQSGQIPASARVCRAGTQEWVPIGSVQELAGAAPTAYQAPAPPYGGGPPVSQQQQPQSWYVQSVQGGAPLGPMTEQQVMQELAQGRVSPGSSVCAVGSTQWMPMNQVPPFASHLQGMGVQQPPPAYGYGAPPQPQWGGAPAPMAPQTTAFKLGVDIFAVMLVVSFILPLASKRKLIFAWDMLEHLNLEIFLFLIYPLIAGIALLVLNRLKVPAIVGPIVWAVLGLLPLVVGLDAVNTVATHEGIPLNGLVFFLGAILFSTTLFLRYLRWQSTIFRLSPILGGAALALAYVIPVTIRGTSFMPIEIIFKLFDLGGAIVTIAGLLSLVPLVLAVVGIVMGFMPARSAPTFSRVLGQSLIWYFFGLLMCGALITAIDGRGEFFPFVHAAIYIGSYLYLSASGIAVAVNAIAGAPKQP